MASDENLHHLFYRDLAAAAFVADPSGMVQAAEREVKGFAMPGWGIPKLRSHTPPWIARAGIYDLAIHHSQIVVPVVVKQWRIAELEGLTPQAEASRDRLIGYIDKMASAQRLQERRGLHRQPGNRTSRRHDGRRLLEDRPESDRADVQRLVTLSAWLMSNSTC